MPKVYPACQGRPTPVSGHNREIKWQLLLLPQDYVLLGITSVFLEGLLPSKTSWAALCGDSGFLHCT